VQYLNHRNHAPSRLVPNGVSFLDMLTEEG